VSKSVCAPPEFPSDDLPPDRWFRAYFLRVARAHVRNARKMFACGDDRGLTVGIDLLVEAAARREQARRMFRPPRPPTPIAE
jgi:hypothetical protein